MKKIKDYDQLVLFVTSLTESYDDDAIILYDIGKYYVAIGDAAESLFKLFRWDFREAHNLVKSCLFSLVTKDGLACLQNKHIYVVIRETDIRYVGDYDSNYSDTQQFLDLIRSYTNEGNVYLYPIIRQTVVIDTPGMQRIARVSALVVDSLSISVELDGRESYSLVDDMIWDYTQVGVSIMSVLNNIITQQHDLMLEMARDKAQATKTVKEANTYIYQLYSYCKGAHKEEVIVVKQRGFFITFDDDAIVVSDKLSIPLYECQTFGLRNHTAAIITPDDFSSLTDMDINIHVIATDHIHNMYEFCLSGQDLLNCTYDKDIAYDDVAIIKDVTGDYMIKATYEGIKLDPVTISNQTGMYILCLDNLCLERKYMLAALVHQTFDKKASYIRQQLKHNEE